MDFKDLNLEKMNAEELVAVLKLAEREYPMAVKLEMGRYVLGRVDKVRQVARECGHLRTFYECLGVMFVEVLIDLAKAEGKPLEDAVHNSRTMLNEQLEISRKDRERRGL